MAGIVYDRGGVWRCSKLPNLPSPTRPISEGIHAHLQSQSSFLVKYLEHQGELAVVVVTVVECILLVCFWSSIHYRPM